LFQIVLQLVYFNKGIPGCTICNVCIVILALYAFMQFNERKMPVRDMFAYSFVQVF